MAQQSVPFLSAESFLSVPFLSIQMKLGVQRVDPHLTVRRVLDKCRAHVVDIVIAELEKRDSKRQSACTLSTQAE